MALCLLHRTTCALVIKGELSQSRRTGPLLNTIGAGACLGTPDPGLGPGTLGSRGPVTDSAPVYTCPYTTWLGPRPAPNCTNVVLQLIYTVL